MSNTSVQPSPQALRYAPPGPGAANDSLVGAEMAQAERLANKNPDAAVKMLIKAGSDAISLLPPPAANVYQQALTDAMHTGKAPDITSLNAKMTQASAGGPPIGRNTMMCLDVLLQLVGHGSASNPGAAVRAGNAESPMVAPAAATTLMNTQAQSTNAQQTKQNNS